MSAVKTLGQVAFEAFHTNLHGPKWDAGSNMHQPYWERAAQAVADTIQADYDHKWALQIKAQGAAEERERVSKLLARWEEFGIDAPNGMSAVEWLRDGGKPVAECCNCGPRRPALPGTDMCNECFEDDRFNQ